jgi:hypothetical protein
MASVEAQVVGTTLKVLESLVMQVYKVLWRYNKLFYLTSAFLLISLVDVPVQ